MCPKIKSNNIKFVVSQIGENQFQASFIDSKGNIASLLPDRTLTYKTNDGKTVSITISGGTGVFTVDANDGDLIRATVDNSNRDNTYDSNSKPQSATNGQTPSYSYPSIPNYQIYEDIANGYTGGSGNGDGLGDGTGGNANSGDGKLSQDSNSDGNSTHSQKANPSNSANNPVKDVSQSYDVSDAIAQAGASQPSSGDSGNPSSQSVAKQILIDEDEFFKVTGISFIILLMILTVYYYYREDIHEMNSKR